MRRSLTSLRAYPFLIAAYPSLAMLAANVEQVHPGVVVRPLLISLLLCGVLYGLLLQLRSPTESAALLTTWWLMLFFSYGHLYAALRSATVFGESLGRHRYLATTWAILAVGGAWWILRRRPAGRWPQVLTVISLAAVATPIVQLAAFGVGSHAGSAEQQTGKTSAAGLLPEGQRLQALEGGPLPDIYYIILDGYGRSDTLGEVYHYDNADFLEALESMGFVVGRCSQSNYAQTDLSLASSTNLQYLDALGDSFRPGTDNRLPLRSLIRSSAVRRSLESIGYQTVAFDTGYPFINLEDADRYLSPDLGAGVSGFELMFLRSTAGLVALDSTRWMPRLLASELQRPDSDHRQRVVFAFDQLERLPAVPGPKYVYAHIVAPHDPYVFNAEGDPVDPPAAGSEPAVIQQAYADQARFVSRRTVEMLRVLLGSSDVPPVIILQGDHGPGDVSHAGRMGILNAYYFPEAEEVIYPSITPVNSFRMLFNSVFGTSFSRLPDISYFSIYPAPYDFTVVPPSCPP